MAEVKPSPDTAPESQKDAVQPTPPSPKPNSQPSAVELTTRLSLDVLSSLQTAPASPYGLAPDNPVQYVTIPRDRAVIQQQENVALPRWRIELHGLPGAAKPLGFDIVGDVVIGVGKADSAPPDVDLAGYEAARKGVSRRHALFRPTRNRLYIIDLGSTNGTKCDALPVGLGVATEVKDSATITLGNLTFSVSIISRPEPDAQPAPAPSAGPASVVTPAVPDQPAQPSAEAHPAEQPPSQPRIRRIRWLTAASFKQWLKPD
jgi:hypothetical protein